LRGVVDLNLLGDDRSSLTVTLFRRTAAHAAITVHMSRWPTLNLLDER
jgi:hypothetical protein